MPFGWGNELAPGDGCRRKKKKRKLKKGRGGKKNGKTGDVVSSEEGETCKGNWIFLKRRLDLQTIGKSFECQCLFIIRVSYYLLIFLILSILVKKKKKSFFHVLKSCWSIMKKL